MNSGILIEVAIKLLNESGGFSLDCNSNKPIDGYMVAMKGFELKTTLENKSEIASYINKHYISVARGENYFGGWVNEGVLYLDIATNVKNKESAIRLGRKNEQLAIYDIDNQREIHL